MFQFYVNLVLLGFLGLPKGSGKLKDITRFDAHFFGITETEAHLMDAQIRIMLELTYEAIWDAGWLYFYFIKHLFSLFNNQFQ